MNSNYIGEVLCEQLALPLKFDKSGSSRTPTRGVRRHFRPYKPGETTMVLQVPVLADEQGADYVQFLFGEDLKWKFNYATTSKGELLLTEDAQRKCDQRVQEIEEECKKNGRSVGLSVSFVPKK
jgi:hypothetical protein